MIRRRTDLELRRKLLHSLFGLMLILILFYAGRKALIIFLISLLLLGSMMIMLRLKGNRIPIAGWFEETFERKNVRFPGYGAFWYVVGTLLLALSLGDNSEIAAGILPLALGDSAATIFGIGSMHPIPYNRNKTLEGSLAFLIFALPSGLFIGWMGLPLALIAAVVESLPAPYDDNLLIPIAAALFFRML
jgi:dolichol kinase